MKRKFAWFTLTLMVTALIFAAKWHVEHPTPSQADLAVRAAIIESPYGYVTFLPPGGHSVLPFPPPANHVPLSHDQTKCLCSALFRGRDGQSEDFTGFGSRGAVRMVWYYKGGNATRRLEIDLATSNATFTYGGWESPRQSILWISERYLLKVLLKVLLADPRIGPEIRARMKS